MCVLAVVLFSSLSIRQMSTDEVSRRMTTSDPAISLCRFLNYPSGSSDDKFALNPQFWLKGVDFSCVSPWNSGGGRLRAGTAISKRHVVFARHFPLWKNVRMIFVGEDGGICPVRIAATKAVEGTDICVAALNYELTPNIRPAKILPHDYDKFIGNGKGLPVVTFDQNEKAFLTESIGVSTNKASPTMTSKAPPKGSRADAFRDYLVGGDSGNPAFMLIGTEPILLYCLKSGYTGGGPGIHLFRREIQAAMDELCPGYKLEPFDFSGFPL